MFFLLVYLVLYNFHFIVLIFHSFKGRYATFRYVFCVFYMLDLKIYKMWLFYLSFKHKKFYFEFFLCFESSLTMQVFQICVGIQFSLADFSRSLLRRIVNLGFRRLLLPNRSLFFFKLNISLLVHFMLEDFPRILNQKYLT